jgi:hypothetical protein
MTLLSTDVYEDVQYQKDAPIGTQKPIPAGVHEVELSWDRHRGYMRVIIDGQKWWFKEYLGKAQLMGTDNARGRIYLRAMATLEGETLVMYRAPDATPHKLVDGTRRDTTHNRLCYRRAGHEWRLRDERLPWNHPDALVFASSYVGDMNAEWNKLDRVAHVYHNGFTVLDEDNVAHLYDPDLSYA